jgi:hypothetical protein
VVVDQLGAARDDQHRGEPRWDKENPAHAEVAQIERVEFFGIGRALSRILEFGCMVLSVKTSLPGANHAQSGAVGIVAGKKAKSLPAYARAVTSSKTGN